ncbi:reverse transcriptase domain-containing protein [Tanacetum coccineum]
MADQSTMAELLQAPTEGYGDVIVIPAILAENFELKHGLLNLVTSKQFYGFEKGDPHAHIRWFNKITSTIKYKDVPNSSIKLMLFPFSIQGQPEFGSKKNPLQRFDESFCEAWDRFKDLLHACPHHGFTELHQLDTFYNALTPTDQDSLNAAVDGNLLTKTPRDALIIIENKSKVRNSRNKPIVSKVSTNAPSSSTPYFLEIAALADAVKAILAQKSSPPASVKAVEEICVTCGGPHPYHQCLATDGNVFSEYQDNIQGYVSAAAVNYNQGNTVYRPQSASTLKPTFIGRQEALSSPELTPTQMILELADRSTTSPSVLLRSMLRVLGFRKVLTSGFFTMSLDPILSTSSPSSLLLRKGDLLLLEKLLNDDPSSPLPLKELNLEELKTLKSSIDDPPELELKDLPSHLEYAILFEGTDKLPVIIAKNLKEDEKVRLLKVLKSHKRAIAWKISDIKSIDPQFCTYKILMEDDSKPEIQHQRRVNPKIHEVVKKEVIKLLDSGLIYPISDSPWVSPVHCGPKKGSIIVIKNEYNELIPTRLVTGWRVCIDNRKLNDSTCKDHFPLPFMDQMLERLVGNEYYCFLDGFSGYFHIPIDQQDQDKTTSTCPYGTFAYRRMPFGLCNALGTFQRCMMAIFHDMIEETMEVFMDDFSVFRDSFSSCLLHLDKMLKRCEDTNLVLN